MDPAANPNARVKQDAKEIARLFPGATAVSANPGSRRGEANQGPTKAEEPKEIMMDVCASTVTLPHPAYAPAGKQMN